MFPDRLAELKHQLVCASGALNDGKAADCGIKLWWESAPLHIPNCVNVLSLYYHVMILLMYCRITHEASGDTAEVKVYSVFCLFVFGQCHDWWNAKCTVYVCKAVTDRFDWRQTFVEAPLPSLCRLTLSLHPSQPDLNTLITVSFLFKVFWMLIESIFYLSSV